MTDKEKLRALLMTIMTDKYSRLFDACDAAGIEHPKPVFGGWVGLRKGGYLDGTGSYWKPSEMGLKFLAE